MVSASTVPKILSLAACHFWLSPRSARNQQSVGCKPGQNTAGWLLLTRLPAAHPGPACSVLQRARPLFLKAMADTQPRFPPHCQLSYNSWRFAAIAHCTRVRRLGPHVASLRPVADPSTKRAVLPPSPGMQTLSRTLPPCHTMQRPSVYAARRQLSAARFPPRCVVQYLRIHAAGRQLHIAHHRAADEAVAH